MNFNNQNPQYIKTLMMNPPILDAIHAFYHDTIAFLDDWGTDDNGDTIPPRIILAHYFDPALNPKNDPDEFARDTLHQLEQLDHAESTESNAVYIHTLIDDLGLLDDDGDVPEGIYRILDQLFDICDQQHKIDTN